MDELARRFFAATHDSRPIITDPQAGYFGTPVDDQSLVPGPNARVGKATFGDWLQSHAG